MMNFNFNHDTEVIPVAMGYDIEIDEKCREIVYFSTFSNYFIKNEFYDDQAEVPSNLTTTTGILEKALNLCKTEEEQIYTIFIFKNISNNASNALKSYIAYESASDKKYKEKIKVLLELSELEARLSDEKREDLVTPKDMFRKIEKCKENLYNFDNYLSAINESKD